MRYQTTYQIASVSIMYLTRTWPKHNSRFFLSPLKYSDPFNFFSKPRHRSGFLFSPHFLYPTNSPAKFAGFILTSSLPSITTYTSSLSHYSLLPELQKPANWSHCFYSSLFPLSRPFLYPVASVLFKMNFVLSS